MSACEKKQERRSINVIVTFSIPRGIGSSACGAMDRCFGVAASIHPPIESALPVDGDFPTGCIGIPLKALLVFDQINRDKRLRIGF